MFSLTARFEIAKRGNTVIEELFSKMIRFPLLFGLTNLSVVDIIHKNDFLKFSVMRKGKK